MKKLSLFLSLGALLLTGCAKNDYENFGAPGQKAVVAVTTSGMDAMRNGDLMAIQIYRADEAGDYKPYAHGLFDASTAPKFNAITGDSYKITATTVRQADTKIAKTGDVYGKPFATAATEGFIYDDSELQLSSSEVETADGGKYDLPNIERYYTETSKQINYPGQKLTLEMKPVSFKVTTTLDNNTLDGLKLSVTGAPEVTFSKEETAAYRSTYGAEATRSTVTTWYQVKDIVKAYSATDEEPYSESFRITLTDKNGKIIFETKNNIEAGTGDDISITANEDGYIVFDKTTSVPAEKLLTVTDDNLFYGEVPAGTQRRYRVSIEAQEPDPDMVKWYVDGTLKGKGTDFTYTTEAGNHTVSYKIPAEYSATGSEITKSAAVNVWTSTGIYILNEPNMTATETARGINRYTYGSTTVERFVKGDYTMFGATAQHITNWAGYLYVVSPYVQSGVSFSSFDAKTGSFVKAAKSVNDAATSSLRAFAGVSPTQGVITSKQGAWIVTLDNGDFEIGADKINGTESGADNVFVTDGTVFIIANGKALAYKAEGFTASSEPKVLGDATVGFVQSKDGYVWAAKGGNLLRIDPYELSVETVTIGAEIKFSSSPWKQASWVASTTENVMYFTKDSWGTSKEVYKYDITTGTLTPQFIAAEAIDNYMLYATSLYFDPQKGELLCSAIKGYGANSAYNALFGFASDGTKTTEVLYETTDPDIYGEKDFWFPAMMCPIKNFASPVR